MAVQRWYPSKVDWWLAILLAIAPVASVIALIGTLLAGTGVVIAAGGVLVLAAVYLGLVFPMRYGIDVEHLVVRHGVVRQQIRLSDITEVLPTRSPLSSPALSLDRLAIKFGEGFFKSAMISPAAKAEFLSELATRANLRREGERLIR
ncbi:MAG: PH domain-containing protein [Deltaproteobacteria bacterium]|nr:PH domain-containing protein [Deltaproteobacteria bacterium]